MAQQELLILHMAPHTKKMKSIRFSLQVFQLQYYSIRLLIHPLTHKKNRTLFSALHKGIANLIFRITPFSFERDGLNLHISSTRGCN